MSYTQKNYKTKKALREDITAGKTIWVQADFATGKVPEGDVYLEGPHYPAPHTWFAKTEVRGGRVIRIVE